MDTVTKERLPPKTDLSQWDLRELIEAVVNQINLFVVIADHSSWAAKVQAYLDERIAKSPEVLELRRRDPDAVVEAMVVGETRGGADFYDVLLMMEVLPHLQPIPKEPTIFLNDFETL